MIGVSHSLSDIPLLFLFIWHSSLGLSVSGHLCGCLCGCCYAFIQVFASFPTRVPLTVNIHVAKLHRRCMLLWGKGWLKIPLWKWVSALSGGSTFGVPMWPVQSHFKVGLAKAHVFPLGIWLRLLQRKYNFRLRRCLHIFYLSVCLSVYLFVCLSVYLYVCLSVYIFPSMSLPGNW